MMACELKTVDLSVGHRTYCSFIHLSWPVTYWLRDSRRQWTRCESPNNEQLHYSTKRCDMTIHRVTALHGGLSIWPILTIKNLMVISLFKYARSGNDSGHFYMIEKPTGLQL